MSEPTDSSQMTPPAATLVLTSPAFQESGAIPAKYTCDGVNISPSLQWMAAPESTKSFALIVHDPDAPMGTWIHWVAWNIPASSRSLSEALSTNATLPDGMRQGVTDFGTTGYGGPCPPSGTHRYIFTLSALDMALSLSGRVTAQQLEGAMQGHVLAQARVMGTYRRAKR